jgi:hypothetical protein
MLRLLFALACVYILELDHAEINAHAIVAKIRHKRCLHGFPNKFAQIIFLQRDQMSEMRW